MKRLVLVLSISCIIIGSDYLYAYFACGSTGITWTQVGNTGMASNLKVVYEPTGNALYVTGNDGSGGGIVRSTDGGVTWQVFNTGSPSGCHWGIGLNDIGEVISGGLVNGSVIGCRGGDTTSRYFIRLVGNVLPWVSSSTTACCPNAFFLVSVIAAPNGNTIAAGSGILAFSTDHGATWKAPNTQPPNSGAGSCGEKLGLANSPDNLTTNLTVANTANNNACAPFFSTDGGVNWTVIPQGMPQGFTTLGDGNVGNLINGSLLFSFNGGVGPKTWCYGPQPPPNGNWTQCDTGIGPRHALNAFITNPSKTELIALMGGNTVSGNTVSGCGLFFTTDNAAHWNTADNGLPTGTNPPPPCNIIVMNQALTIDKFGFAYAIANTGEVFKTTTAQ